MTGATIAAFIAVDVFLLGVIVALVGIVYWGLADRVGTAETTLKEIGEKMSTLADDVRELVGELEKDVSEKLSTLVADMNQVRNQIAEHLRWSRGEHKRLDRQYERMNSKHPNV